MTGHEPPARWYGPCPFCGTESVHTLGEDRQCGTCGFRFRVEDWAED